MQHSHRSEHLGISPVAVKEAIGPLGSQACVANGTGACMSGIHPRVNCACRVEAEPLGSQVRERRTASDREPEYVAFVCAKRGQAAPASGNKVWMIRIAPRSYVVVAYSY